MWAKQEPLDFILQSQNKTAYRMGAPASNYGERFVMAVREYLTQNGLKSLGQINAKILADLAQRFYEKDAAANKTKRRHEIEQEWIASLETDPTFAGIDIKRELGKCQFWCKERRFICTRARFSNWLLRADKTVGFTYDGASSRPKPIEPARPVLAPEKPVPGWPLILRNQVTGIAEDKIDVFCASDWHELPAQVRELIVQFA